MTRNSCWVWLKCKDKNGYGVFYDGKKNIKAHRYSYELYVNKIRKGLCCLHKCDNPSCVNPEHLFLGTMQDNMADKMSKGRHKTNATKGSKNPFAKLTEKQVLEIRQKFSTGKYTKEGLGIEYKVSSTTIRNIIIKKKWKHI